MKSFFLLFVGAIIASIGVLGIIFNWEKATGLTTFFCILATLGGLIFSIGIAALVTVEGGMNQELIKRTTFLQRLVGNIPIIDRNKYPPFLKKYLGVIFGILILCAGISSGLFYKDWMIMPILMISQGISLIIFSLIYCK